MTPGWKTSEFWLSLLAVSATAVIGSGLVHDGGTAAKVLALVVSILATLGYTASRTTLKLKQGTDGVFRADEPTRKSIPVVPATVLLLLCLASGTMSGCCYFSPASKGCKVETQFIDCTAEAMMSIWPGIMGNAITALAGDSPSWSQLAALEASATADEAQCAIQALLGLKSVPGIAPEELANIQKNARLYLAKKSKVAKVHR